MKECDTMIALSPNKCNCFFEKSMQNYEKNDKSYFITLINSYNNYINCNNFNDLRCPCCKRKGVLFFHKTYERNLTYIENSIKTDAILSIAVLECKHCKESNNIQKYHSLLPFFVLPYHIHEASMIIDAAYKYLIKQMKLKQILEKLKITHKLFYDWINKINKYLLPSSIVLKENNKLIKVVKQIYKQRENFLIDFFDNYQHPYFLFRITCVPLCITP